MNSGYSRKPLYKKLGIKEGFKIRLINPPGNYFRLLGDIPFEVHSNEDIAVSKDFIHFFVETENELKETLFLLKDEILKNGMIWVSWYKKSSKIPTDVTEDVIRQYALPLGLVDVKVCAVDEKWSGLKLMWRKENR